MRYGDESPHDPEIDHPGRRNSRNCGRQHDLDRGLKFGCAKRQRAGNADACRVRRRCAGQCFGVGDFTASEDDNVLVQGIEKDANSLGYIPYAYYEPHQKQMKALAIDGAVCCLTASPRIPYGISIRRLAADLSGSRCLLISPQHFGTPAFAAPCRCCARWRSSYSRSRTQRIIVAAPTHLPCRSNSPRSTDRPTGPTSPPGPNTAATARPPP